jgi:hypothetical protein
MNIYKNIVGMSERKYLVKMKKLDVILEKIRCHPYTNMTSTDMSIMCSVKCAVRWIALVMLCAMLGGMTCNINDNAYKKNIHVANMKYSPDIAIRMKFYMDINGRDDLEQNEMKALMNEVTKKIDK